MFTNFLAIWAVSFLIFLLVPFICFSADERPSSHLWRIFFFFWSGCTAWEILVPRQGLNPGRGNESTEL